MSVDVLPDPPLTRREARRETRRDAILGVAARYFLEHGYAGTTMSGIAAELGGSKGTLWNYFPSKELLFGAVLDRVTNDFRKQLTVTLHSTDTLETALRKFCTTFLRRVTSPNSIALHRLVVGEAARFPEMGRIFFERAPARTYQLLADYLREAAERGELRLPDPVGAAQHLMALCTARSHQRLISAVVDKLAPGEAEADAEAAVATFLHGFGLHGFGQSGAVGPGPCHSG